VDSALDLHSGQGRRIGDGQAAQSDGIQQLKDGCVCSDAEREGDDRGGREDRALAQCAQGKPQVLKRSLEPKRSTVVARKITLTVSRLSVFASRFLQRIFPTNSSTH
jgi:hypothetical protein